MNNTNANTNTHRREHETRRRMNGLEGGIHGWQTNPHVETRTREGIETPVPISKLCESCFDMSCKSYVA